MLEKQGKFLQEQPVWGRCGFPLATIPKDQLIPHLVFLQLCSFQVLVSKLVKCHLPQFTPYHFHCQVSSSFFPNYNSSKKSPKGSTLSSPPLEAPMALAGGAVNSTLLLSFSLTSSLSLLFNSTVSSGTLSFLTMFLNIGCRKDAMRNYW